MALSCYEIQTMFFSHSKNANIKTKYENTLQRFKKMQLADGSFGNFHTTSLITQALISSGQENATDWNTNATIQYLMQQLKMPHDLLASYLVLPVLNAKSLSDISKINCSLNPKRKGYDSFTSEMSYYEGQTMRIQYSLYMGDKKDVIHTISLLAPVNCTAYNVMELAASKDYKFTFKSRNMYVYQIDEVTNDSEAGLFWFCYNGNASHSISRCIKGLDQVVMQDEEHLVMWYKKAIL
ncbi:uncharacterized protein CG3556 [Parasteatoda tepidariorum]|uniref:uncharacterized protein CG3556 n=1 Tax=Parasteatoda tepidariorum TaxID=114398 RepID=UPI001C71C27D|nr:uncharacterized protein CG3556 [Parasteatoda tepidariorum]